MPVKTRYDEILELQDGWRCARDGESTDVTAATKAQLFWQFYRDAQDACDTAREKMRIFASAYLAEMRKASIPYWLRREHLKAIRDGDKDGRLRRKLAALVFGEDFAKTYKPKITEIVPYNAYNLESTWGAYLRLEIRKGFYELYVPFPENVKPKDLDGIEPVKFKAYHKRTAGVTDFCDETGEASCGYDWARVAGAIRNHVAAHYPVLKRKQIPL